MQHLAVGLHFLKVLELYEDRENTAKKIDSFHLHTYHTDL